MVLRSTLGSLLTSTLVFASLVALSPLSASTATAASSGDVVFNEILFHPEDDDPAGEYLELLNTTGTSIDLAGWCIDGVDFCFPGRRVIAAGGLLVTTSAEWDGRLSNGGEDIALLDPTSTIVDALEYDDKGTWPANTDGNGASLQRRRVSAPSDDPGNWFGGRPTPNATNIGRGAPFLTVDDVEHPVSPAAGTPLRLTARADGATSARVEYRVGFFAVRDLAATVSDGQLSATIPARRSGELVRYRWIVEGDGRTGTWPRQGDGMDYTGTVVASPAASGLPRFQWFMEDSVFDTARNDLTKRGDDGYPAVFAYDGEVFDNTTVRVKGQSSRLWPKKKWKFVLPAGHDVEIDGLTDEDVDEFALHSSWSDTSFLREVLSAEFLDEVGLPVSQAFPVRLERNGEFFGAYTYVEQQDGTFRDRQDYGDATVYEVGGNALFGDLRASHAALSQEQLRERYDKGTNEFEDDEELRDLIRLINQPSVARRADVIENRIDASTVINSIAASMVIQHQDWGLKNYDLRLTDQGLWAIAPTDFDLTWGRRYELSPCGGLCDAVYTGGAFEHPGQALFDAFWSNPYYRAKIRQRIRTIVDEHFDPTRWTNRALEIRNQIVDDAFLDRAVWGTYGPPQDPVAAAGDLINRFIVPQHQRLTGSLLREGRVSATGQPADPRVSITDVKYEGSDADPAYVVMTNFEAVPVDISGFEIEELDFVATGGTILDPGESAIAVHEDADSVRGRYGARVFAGLLDDEPADADGGFTLTDRQGDRLSSQDLVVPGELTSFSGRPGESAMVNVVATETARSGFLQVVDCDTEPGATSNLNLDDGGQTRAGAAVGRFDGDGELCVFNSGATHIVVDVSGYFDDSAIDDVDDVRLLDSRSGSKLRGGATVILNGRPNSSAFLNLVSDAADGPGFLQVVPCGAATGTSSNLNFDRAGQTRSGLAVGRFDADGTVCIYASATTHVIVDLQAYLAEDSLDDVTDQRLVDTRTTAAKPGEGSIIRFQGRPDSSAFVSLTLTEAERPGYAQLVPCAGGSTISSNVNIDQAGQTIANLAVAEFDSNGEACLLVVIPTHVVIDLQAYLTDPAFDDIVDTRLLDTRN